MRALALVGILGTGCNAILGIGDVHTSSTIDAPAGIDGPAVDAAPSDCPAAGPSEVVGCAMITHVLADGSTMKTRKDLSTFNVSAYVVDGTQSSGFRIINGTTGNGVFHIQGVDPGAQFFVRLHDPSATSAWPHYFFTDKHDLDLGYTVMGRDGTPVTADTEVTFNASGLSPWVKYQDYLSVGSFNTGTESAGLPGPTVIAGGATTASGTLDWRS